MFQTQRRSHYTLSPREIEGLCIMCAISSVRLKAAGMLAGLSLLLSGCFLQPGTFTSQLTLLANNDFTFTYEDEIYILGLAQLMEELSLIHI